MPTDTTGSLIRNLFTLRGLENALADDVNELIEALFDDVAAQVARIDPTGVSETYRAARLRKLMREIERLTGSAFDEIAKLVRQRGAEIGVSQGAFAEETLRAAVSGVAVDIVSGAVGLNLMKAILDENPIQGHLLRDWFRGQKTGTAFKVRQQIQLGMAQNEGIDDLVRRVRGRRVGFRRRDAATGAFVPKGTKGAVLEPVFRGGVMATTTREATALVRTAVNHISNAAHERTYAENLDVTEEYEIVAILDARTSEICMAMDGRRFRHDDPSAKRPPFHINCRTGTRAVIKWEELGVDPPEEGTRASQDGQVPSSTRYEGWLRGRSVEEQDEILGPGRAKLFRAGKLSLRDLVRADNSRVRLEELAA